MTNIILLIPVLIGFFVTLFILPFWINKTKELGIVWDDLNKLKWRKVSGSGGVIVVLGFTVGILAYVSYMVFYLNYYSSRLVEILALLNVILISCGVGFVDDLFGWRKGGLTKISRIILIFVSSIPLVAINSGKSLMTFPFIGSVELGVVYPLVLIPIGILGATTTFNFLAGFNGLEAGQGIILLSGLGIVAFFTGNSWISVVSLIMVACLAAFLLFNFFPAKIFPGDSLTYPVGGLIAMTAILGNFEKIAVFFFIPYVLEVGLKLRGKLKKHSFGKPSEDGTLRLRYEKIYGLEHLSIYLMQKYKIKPTEKKVVFSIWAFQALIILIGLIIFKGSVFLR